MQNSLLSYEKICPGNIEEERIVVQFSGSDSKVFINEFIVSILHVVALRLL